MNYNNKNNVRQLGINLNGYAADDRALGLNQYLTPEALDQNALGSNNWIDPESLGTSGVSKVLDNRHISGMLHERLCSSGEGGEVRREYFGTLIELAWSSNDAKFQLCCSEPAGKNATLPCLEPDYTFAVPSEDGLEPPALAPHFLTPAFGPEQQEVLTAALIAKTNVQEKELKMELAGRLDLGAAGTRFMPRKHFEEFPHELGRAWGNMFLNCLYHDNIFHELCEASTEQDRQIGRNPAYFSHAMFTCSGDHDDYPVAEMGKSCFSKDMATNIENGCDLVAASGPCDEVCVAGFCGVNSPAIEGRGTTNVLYVYMGEPPEDITAEDDDYFALKFALPLAAFFILLTIAAWFQHKKRNKVEHTAASSDANDKVEVTDKDDADDAI